MMHGVVSISFPRAHITTSRRGSAGIDPAAIDALGLYWEGVREVYSPFEGQGLKSGSSEVYSHEMPGGQYTNLKFQALSLGLGNQWPKVGKLQRGH